MLEAPPPTAAEAMLGVELDISCAPSKDVTADSSAGENVPANTERGGPSLAALRRGSGESNIPPRQRYHMASFATAGLKANALARNELDKTVTYEKMMQHFQLRKVSSYDAVGAAAVAESAQLALSRPSSAKSMSRKHSPSSSVSEGVEDAADPPDEEELLMIDTVDQPVNSVTIPNGDPQLHKIRPLIRQQSSRPVISNVGTQRHRVPRWWRRLRRQVRHVMAPLAVPLSPVGALTKVRAVAQLVAFLVQVLSLPLVPAYFPIGCESVRKVMVFLELVYLIDVVLHLNTSYYDHTSLQLVTSRQKIFERYAKGWLIWDLLGAVPIETFGGKGGREDNVLHVVFHAFFRVGRLVHFAHEFREYLRVSQRLRIAKNVISWLFYSRSSHLVRIVNMIMSVVLAAHYVACGWHLLTRDDPNAPNAARAGATVLEQYTSDINYAVMLIHGQGEYNGLTPLQNVFPAVVVILGSVIIAIVFGNIAMLVSNFNANSTKYQRKMEALFETMNKLDLPVELRERIQQYYEHLWREYESLDGDIVKFSRELTHTLAIEVGLVKYMGLIMNVPFWQDCTPDFVTQIVLSLVVRVYLPDDFVIRQGEVGQELFMINRGTCELPLPPLSRPYPDTGSDAHMDRFSPRNIKARRQRRSSSIPRIQAMFKEFRNKPAEVEDDGACRVHAGQSFGEMALLVNYRRTATVRAATYVEMCILERSSFQKILMKNPEDRHTVLRTLLTHCVEKGDMPILWDHVQEVLAKEMQISVSELLQQRDKLPTNVIVNALLHHVDRECVDNSLVFGFQSRRRENRTDHAATTTAPDSRTNESPQAALIDGRGYLSILQTQLTSVQDQLSALVQKMTAVDITSQRLDAVVSAVNVTVKRVEQEVKKTNVQLESGRILTQDDRDSSSSVPRNDFVSSTQESNHRRRSSAGSSAKPAEESGEIGGGSDRTSGAQPQRRSMVDLRPLGPSSTGISYTTSRSIMGKHEGTVTNHIVCYWRRTQSLA